MIKLFAQPESPRDPEAWLVRVVRNASINAARDEVRRSRHERDGAADRLTWFRETADADWTGADVEAALRELTAEDCEIVTLHIWGQQSFEQIAKSLPISSRTVARRYHAALARLRRSLQNSTSTLDTPS